MSVDRSDEIQEIIDRESRAYDTADTELMLTIYHPDIVWAWPPNSTAYDPMEWVLRMGRFDYDRWYKLHQQFFDTHTIIHNRRVTKKIVMSEQQDGAFAVVDVDTMFSQNRDMDSPWHEEDGSDKIHVQGRACKIYTLMDDGWKLLYQPGTMQYPVTPA